MTNVILSVVVTTASWCADSTICSPPSRHNSTKRSTLAVVCVENLQDRTEFTYMEARAARWWRLPFNLMPLGPLAVASVKALRPSLNPSEIVLRRRPMRKKAWRYPERQNTLRRGTVARGSKFTFRTPLDRCLSTLVTDQCHNGHDQWNASGLAALGLSYVVEINDAGCHRYITTAQITDLFMHTGEFSHGFIV